MTKLTVTEGLVKLKLYEKRITDAVARLKVIEVLEPNKNPTGFKTDEEFKRQSESQFQQVERLIANRDNLKSAIVKSNAETVLKIGEHSPMTVAQAIEKKSSIAFQKAVLANLDKCFAWGDAQINQLNTKIDADADNFVKGLTTGPNQNADLANKSRMEYIANRKPRQVYNEKVKARQDALRKEIEDFEANVDIALSVSNAVTLIEVDL